MPTTNYDDYDEDGEEKYVDKISFEEKPGYEMGYFIKKLDFYNRAEGGHQFNDLIRSCTWKGHDCKSGYVQTCV